MIAFETACSPNKALLQKLLSVEAFPKIHVCFFSKGNFCYMRGPTPEEAAMTTASSFNKLALKVRQFAYWLKSEKCNCTCVRILWWWVIILQDQRWCRRKLVGSFNFGMANFSSWARIVTLHFQLFRLCFIYHYQKGWHLQHQVGHFTGRLLRRWWLMSGACECRIDVGILNEWHSQSLWHFFQSVLFTGWPRADHKGFHSNDEAKDDHSTFQCITKIYLKATWRE